MARLAVCLLVLTLVGGGFSCSSGGQGGQATGPSVQVPQQMQPKLRPQPNESEPGQPVQPQPDESQPEQAQPSQPQPNQAQQPAQPRPTKSPTFNDANIVRDVNAIIDQVNQPLPRLAPIFRRGGAKPESADIVLLGENHVDEKGLVDQIRALKKLARPGDLVLLEGNDPIADGWQDCDTIVFRVYTAKKWNELHPNYDPDEHYRLQKVLNVPWTREKKSLNLKSLNLDKLKCNFWDIRHHGQLNLSSLKRRNISMVNQLKRHLGKGQRIFVLAGYAHLPIGDLHEFKHFFFQRPGEAKQWYQIPTPNSLMSLKQPEYYSRLKNGAVQSRGVQDKFGFGSTEDLYAFLRNLNYSEIIPRYILAHPEMCGEACD